MSTRELGRIVGMSKSMVSRVEIGKRQATGLVIERWADATGTTVADMLLDGPALHDLTYVVRCSPFDARRVLGALPLEARAHAAVLPSVSDGVLRVRARSSCLPLLLDLTGTAIPGVSGDLPAPVITPVRAASALTSWMHAPSEADARERLGPRLDGADVEIRRVASVWVASMRGIGDALSLRLQDIVAGSPLGMFVPSVAYQATGST